MFKNCLFKFNNFEVSGGLGFTFLMLFVITPWMAGVCSLVRWYL